jgi:hypothetical protein
MHQSVGLPLASRPRDRKGTSRAKCCGTARDYPQERHNGSLSGIDGVAAVSIVNFVPAGFGLAEQSTSTVLRCPEVKGGAPGHIGVAIGLDGTPK